MPVVVPKVELLAFTGGEKIAALAAKLCYSDASISDLTDAVAVSEQEKFLATLNRMRHHSVFEHISFTFGIEGVSRAFTHQLVRHRIASYSQQSQRYVAHTGGFDYIAPSSVAANTEALEKYNEIMNSIAGSYDKLAALGIPAEDARYLLPNACATKIIVTMNARELLHFFRLRCCERAQWEIRGVAVEMLKKVVSLAPSVFGLAGPSCVSGACSEGRMSCGRASENRRKFEELRTSAMERNARL
ncbi:MAG: FAD-dependent thymidylate synthase [Deferribacteraceae bacterium]|jgi:thymidylate synthase (FAD)|nr:FAD-dependent thymidylate synthase [Deferribacteraceae bacterium]